MNKEKIGIFIKYLRNQKKLSQEQLAEKLGTKVKVVKNLEKGKLKLNTELLMNLSKTFKLTTYEIINGHKGTSNDDKNKAILALLSESKKRRKKKFILKIIFIIFILVCILSSIWLYKNRDWGYLLNGESENFSYSDSMFLHDNGIYYFTFGNIEIKNENIIRDDIVFIRLKCGDRLIIGSSNILTGMTHETKGYDELFPKEVVKNIDDWYYEITYTIDDITQTEILKIESESIN